MALLVRASIIQLFITFVSHFYLAMWCSIVLNARIVYEVRVIEQITPSVIIKVMHHLRLFTLIYGVLHLLRGLAPITTTASFRWFVTFIDDCTRVSWVYMLRYKKNVLPVFHKFVTMVQPQFSMNIKTLRSDNIDEYIG
jgi:hypothetical protein